MEREERETTSDLQTKVAQRFGVCTTQSSERLSLTKITVNPFYQLFERKRRKTSWLKHLMEKKRIWKVV